MKKPYLLILFFCFLFHTEIKAQDSLNQREYSANKIKINPINIFINEFAISYEHRFSDKWGLEIMGGRIYTNMGAYNPGTFFYILFMNQGVVSRIGLKYYLQGRDKNYYLQAMMMYKYTCYYRMDSYVGSIITDPEWYNESNFVNSAEVSIIYGHDKCGHESFADFYIGLGIRYVCGEDITYSHDYPAANIFHVVYSPEQHQYGHGFAPVLKLGIKTGFGFTRRKFRLE